MSMDYSMSYLMSYQWNNNKKKIKPIKMYKPKPAPINVKSVKCDNSISHTRCGNFNKFEPIKAYKPKQKGGIIKEKMPIAVKTIKTTKAIKTKKKIVKTKKKIGKAKKKNEG